MDVFKEICSVEINRKPKMIYQYVNLILQIDHSTQGPIFLNGLFYQAPHQCIRFALEKDRLQEKKKVLGKKEKTRFGLL